MPDATVTGTLQRDRNEELLELMTVRKWDSPTMPTKYTDALVLGPVSQDPKVEASAHSPKVQQFVNGFVKRSR